MAPAPRQTTPPIEKAMAALGLAIVLGFAGILAREAWRGEAREPAIEVEALAAERLDGRHRVRFVARNSGETAAAEVRIEGELRDSNGVVVERSDAQLSYVPGRSQQRGGLFFEHDPAHHQFRIRATGYEKP